MRQSADATVRSQKRPFWFDPRFAIGLVLVVGSVLGVSAVVASVDDTVQVYTARTTLPAGSAFAAADLEITSVRLGTVQKRYLAVSDLPAEGAVLTRAVLKGELVPAAAVSEREVMGSTSVVVALSSEVSAAVTPGAAVDLWGAEQREHGRYGPPIVVVASAEVVRSVDGSGLIGGGTGGVRSIELRLPTAKVAAVLQAIANGDSLSLVPASTGMKALATPSDAPQVTETPAPGDSKSGS